MPEEEYELNPVRTIGAIDIIRRKFKINIKSLTRNQLNQVLDERLKSMDKQIIEAKPLRAKSALMQKRTELRRAVTLQKHFPDIYRKTFEIKRVKWDAGDEKILTKNLNKHIGDVRDDYFEALDAKTVSVRSISSIESKFYRMRKKAGLVKKK